ncbi:class I SAM-dependent methyltransferase [Thiothrix lacustris]|uniref:class I SAM-dependent methyltransferase n=1 Tax=Thiothrix lacustris TaxID=525917 RepID=UPI0027E4D3C9|nr:class I SAM-dependent methyltransferase [Thiothrix lacustris]WMP19418.1 class I SAM-dependent methyltransferase [Thiothrix lacustris]
MQEYTQCTLCDTPKTVSQTTLKASIASSEREFENEKFTVWQCKNCQSIHALEGVDLAHYYSKYGLHEQNEPDSVTRFFFGRKLKWLEKAGIRKDQAILDYGCGGGHFLRFMKEKGYTNAHGYDPFTEQFADKNILDWRYDMVMSSDVIEHDIDVVSHLETLMRLTTPNGAVYIETPDALAINLNNIEQHRQILQQPFHRHILPHTWLIKQAQQRGWKVAQIARHPFFHSRVPFLNVPAMDHYWDTYGGLETLNEGYRWSSLLSPKYWYLGLFGSFIYTKDEVQLVLRHEA